jgi:hypothetical protein
MVHYRVHQSPSLQQSQPNLIYSSSISLPSSHLRQVLLSCLSPLQVFPVQIERVFIISPCLLHVPLISSYMIRSCLCVFLLLPVTNISTEETMFACTDLNRLSSISFCSLLCRQDRIYSCGGPEAIKMWRPLPITTNLGNIAITYK